MRRILPFCYSLLAYAAFLASFAAMVAATTGFERFGIRAIDGAPTQKGATAAAIDLALILAFGVQHSVMARERFKAVLNRWLPPVLERSSYVLASALALGAIVRWWSPIAGTLWTVDGQVATWAFRGVSFMGYALVVASSYTFDHFELFGLKQGWAAAQGRACKAPEFRVPALYRLVRHPMMLGILVGVWAAPRMSWGHVLFAAAMTAYIRVGVVFEERGMARRFGDVYARYRAEVPALLPWPRPSRPRANLKPRSAS
jgi:methanethiol S-methyltransferase